MMQNYYLILLMLSIYSGNVIGDSIQPKYSQLSVEEGITVTLTCSYMTSNTYSYYLYWYRHYPNKALDYILRKTNKGSESTSMAPFAMERFTIQVDSLTTNLTITDVKIEDAAMYYCGLQEHNVTEPSTAAT
ncbi:tripartite motif-containing 7-like [Pelobates cultripes]|uniref:Tripartite motif-containing 7-like n=1 Tax=Pelobates cultripes TaxID=61616 RepID=A0AAD1SZD0_PELCU|nr:tripartite motif-containing 7-like [Pelobates cultripes]CAH2313304.1 tripartite motif-containing 7-like [Pelobates cultripes]